MASSVGARNVLPSVSLTNGDWDANNAKIDSSLIQNNALRVWLDRSVSGGLRINYAVTFPV